MGVVLILTLALTLICVVYISQRRNTAHQVDVIVRDPGFKNLTLSNQSTHPLEALREGWHVAVVVPHVGTTVAKVGPKGLESVDQASYGPILNGTRGRIRQCTKNTSSKCILSRNPTVFTTTDSEPYFQINGATSWYSLEQTATHLDLYQQDSIPIGALNGVFKFDLSKEPDLATNLRNGNEVQRITYTFTFVDDTSSNTETLGDYAKGTVEKLSVGQTPDSKTLLWYYEEQKNVFYFKGPSFPKEPDIVNIYLDIDNKNNTYSFGIPAKSETTKLVGN